MQALYLFIALFSFSVFAEKESKVTLPLEEYTRLKEDSEAPDFTVIESVSVTGEYGKNLKFSISGATSGKPELVTFLELPKGSIYDCKGNAILQKNGYNLQLLSQAKRYSLDCTLHFPNWNEASFTLLNALHLNAKIENGDVILSGDTSRQSVTLTRTASVFENDKAEVTVVGHHRLTVLPEETRFEYRLQLSNPGRSKTSFSLPLKNGEMVQTVTADGEYKDTETAVVFTLNPGINTVSVNGRFKGDDFKVPLPSAQNFLLIENSPMLQLTVNTKARRVSVQDTGMYSQYSTARAYLLSSNESLEWTSKKLEVFASTGYSVNRAHYTVYVPRKGQGIIEAGFEINNQGTPEIPLKVSGQVTYVEVSGIPQVLLKDPSGALLIQVPTGVQQVLVQYEGGKSSSFLGQVLSEELVRPATVMSDVVLNVRLSEKWNLIFGRGLFENRTDLDLSCIFWGILFALVFVMVLKRLVFSKRDLLIAGVSSFLVFTLLPGAGALFVTLLVLVYIYRHRLTLMNHWPKRSWAQIGVVTLGVLIGVFIYSRMDDVRQGFYQSKVGSVEMASQSYEGMPAGAPVMKAKSANRAMPESELAMDMSESSYGGGVGPQATIQTTGDYKGLPAKIKIPEEGRVLTFNQGMIDTETTPSLKLFLIDRGVTALLLILGLLGIAWMVYHHHRKLLDAIKA